jgi:hypothetical protein
MRNKVSGSPAVVSCGCIFLVTNLLLGGWSVNYLIGNIFNKTIPLFWAVIVGLFTGQFTVPISIIVAILKSFRIL